MKLCCLILALLTLLLPLSGLAEDKPLTLLVATDLHYITPDLTDYGPLFMRSVLAGDGKLAEHGEAIVQALIDEAVTRHPAALILTGDLTYNGEYLSLQDLASRLERVRRAGVPVFVLPGNHDIDYPYAAYYEGEQAFYVRGIGSADFRTVCAALGYDRAISRDAASCSYVAALRDDTWLLCLDANNETLPGSILPATLIWAEEQLQSAQAQGVRVISATHQNVVPHNARLQAGYLIDNHAEVSALLRRYGVTINLSGHMHAQSVVTVDGLTDYATGSLTVAPLRFATLTLTDDGAEYTMHRLPVLQEEAAERFGSRTRAQLAQTLIQLGVPEEYREAMADFGAALNAAYFAGEMPENVTETEEWQFWARYAQGTSWWSYMSSMVDDAEK